MSGTGVWAVVPAKRFAEAKSRLAPSLAARDRSALARSMLDHVLGVAERSESLDGVLVATDGDDVEAACAARGVEVVLDRHDDRGRLGCVVDRAIARVSERGARVALALMSDLPRLEPSDVRRLLAALDGADLVLAPDRRDAGTNALALRLPVAMPTELGHPDSFARHLATARRLGLVTAVVRTPGLAHDVDAPDDVASARATSG